MRRRLNRRTLFVPFIAAATMLAAACASDPVSPGDQPPLIEELPRALSEAERSVVRASNAFAFGLLREAHAREQEHPNVVLSPFSASMALAMTMNGAAGTTHDEIHSMLGFDGLTPEQANQSYRDLTELLLGLDPQVELVIANSIWAHSGFPFRQSFYDVVAEYFDAEAQTLDFAASGAPGTINEWVSEHTRGRIETIIEDIPPQMVMYLINAVYFKGSWRDQFDRAHTRTEQFRRDDGSTVPVQMMNATDMEVRLGGVGGVQLAELPYGGDAFTMVVVLPPAGSNVGQLVAGLDEATWSAWTASLGTVRGVPVAMPRFEVTWDGVLNQTLQALGMQQAFVEGGADFTRMAEDPLGTQLYVDEVRQKTFLRVDEEGTEAAAATSVGIGLVSMPVGIRLDRSFLLAIRERHSGAILFLGAIDDPR